MPQTRTKPAASCYDVALTQLGRRDFSCAELSRRLLDKGFEEREVAATIARLLESRYLDEVRYARAVVRTRAQLSGWGVQRIRLDLKKRLLPEAVIRTVMAEYEDKITDAEDGAAPWADKATELLARKYGRWSGTLDPKDYAKRMNFLLRRGFGLDDAKQALAATRDDD
jgi:regulatory protein